jgi:hypothetical protein
MWIGGGAMFFFSFLIKKLKLKEENSIKITLET